MGLENATSRMINKNKVLIVDDDEIFLRILDKRLSSEGYSIAKATSGKEALDIVKKRKPDLIILDIMMPEMDGIETAKALKYDLATNDIPIIFLTALLTKEEERKEKVFLGQKCLAKPVNIEELLKETGKHL